MERHTQTEAYWQQFQLSEEDLDRIYNYLLEATQPVPTPVLARMVVEGRMKEEERRLQEVLSRGRLYRPKEKYDVGDVVVFPALDYAVGTVVGMRQGHNPAYPEFQVIQVQLEGEDRLREFAAGLDIPHRLNGNGESQPAVGAGGLSVDEVFEKYGHYVIDVLERELSERADDFVRIDGGWFLRDSLAEIHVGHLNIADALIDVEGKPLSLDDILPQLELPEEIPQEIQRLSLEYALRHDDRFVSVEVDGDIRWYLRRLLPEALATEPRLLRYDPIPYKRDDIPLSLLQIEWELDDEWSANTEEAPGASLVPSATFILIYPHWRYGTIPMTSRVQGILPEVKADLAQIQLVDGRWGERYTGWVSPQHRLIAGLNDWYEQHKVPVGSYIILERKMDEPNTYLVDFRPRRMKREWVRTARVEEDKVTFEMRKVEVACETDEHVLLSVADPEEIDRLVESLPDPLPPIQEDIAAVFPELAKLHPQGTVHAKTLYSAINVFRRCPPGPIFATLATSDRYRDMGDGSWAEKLS